MKYFKGSYIGGSGDSTQKKNKYLKLRYSLVHFAHNIMQHLYITILMGCYNWKMKKTQEDQCKIMMGEIKYCTVSGETVSVGNPVRVM